MSSGQLHENAGLSRNPNPRSGREDSSGGPAVEGKLIVLTAPLTEIIDHAGYFIQMSMASLPVWLEGVLNRKYPNWRDLEYNEDGSARYMPAGVRLVETSLLREFSADDTTPAWRIRRASRGRINLRPCNGS
jgi:hypothetical protein